MGAVRAGFDLAVAVDLDPHAIAAHKANFPKTTHARRDIRRLSGDQLRLIGKLGKERLSGLIGGPPCQGFSTMGKMRKNDARNKLFFHFFRLVSEANPVFFVCENVPGILGEKYADLRDQSVDMVAKRYDVLDPFALSADAFGAATERSRVFFIGSAKNSGIKLSKKDFLSKTSQRTTVRAALNGLPLAIDPWNNDEDDWRQVTVNDSDYVRTLNRYSLNIGNDNALSRFRDASEVSGFSGTKHSTDVVSRFAKIDPGSCDNISRFPRLEWDALCPTLRAGTGKDRGSYQAARPIHPSENRVITTREAARLQGFPDWFVFDQTKWHSFRQIGNSLSPFVSYHLLGTFNRLLA